MITGLGLDSSHNIINFFFFKLKKISKKILSPKKTRKFFSRLGVSYMGVCVWGGVRVLAEGVCPSWVCGSWLPSQLITFITSATPENIDL